MEEGNEGGCGCFSLIVIILIANYLFSPSGIPADTSSSYQSDYSSTYSIDDYEIEKEKPDGTYTVEACSQNSGNCYDLDADISDGVVETIYFPNGGHLDMDGAELDEDFSASGESYTNSDGYNGDSWDITCSDCE